MIRSAAAADACPIAAIYAHHVLHGTATFDLEPPPADFWTAKIVDLRARDCPFLVTENDGAVTGYAYVAPFRDRAAYARTCENSIYVRADNVGNGIGSALLRALIDASTRRFSEMLAVIGGGEPASVALHARAGFRHVGRMERVGEKFGRLLDTVYMQKTLKEPT